MAYTMHDVISQRNILADGQIQVQRVSIMMEDGIEVNRTYHRWVIHPGQDYSNEPPEVQRICALEHTPERIEQYEVAQRLLGNLPSGKD